MINRVATFKAQRTLRDVPIDDLVLVIDQEIPNFKTLEEAARHHDTEGRAIAVVLLTHLPGGTVDAVLRTLLEKRASLLAVTL